MTWLTILCGGLIALSLIALGIASALACVVLVAAGCGILKSETEGEA